MKAGAQQARFFCSDEKLGKGVTIQCRIFVE